MINGGAISRADIEKAVDDDPDTLAFDAIIVDEAQDWPQPEATLLAAIYGASKVSVADGTEQLLIGRPTDWRRTLSAGETAEEKSLSRCLRMKRNLGLFANTVAGLAGLNWEIEPNDAAAGGKVIFLRGSYADYPDLVAELLNDARFKGNEPVDFLHCVPPSSIVSREDGRRSTLALGLAKHGYETWDAVNKVTRLDYPRDTNQLRVLQYESSRGLEG